jgi:hypothetical protein
MEWLYLQSHKKILNISTGAYFELEKEYDSSPCEYRVMYKGPVGGGMVEGIELARTWFGIFDGTRKECAAQLDYLAEKMNAFGYSQEGGTKRQPAPKKYDPVVQGHRYKMDRQCTCGHTYGVHSGEDDCRSHGCDCQLFIPVAEEEDPPYRPYFHECADCDHDYRIHDEGTGRCLDGGCTCKEFVEVPF